MVLLKILSEWVEVLVNLEHFEPELDLEASDFS